MSDNERDGDLEEKVERTPGGYLNKLTDVFSRKMEILKSSAKNIYPKLEKEFEEKETKLDELVKKLANKKEGEDFSELISDVLSAFSEGYYPYHEVFLKGLFFNLFSEIDAFTQSYLYSIFKLKPDVIDDNNKLFSAKEVFDKKSIEAFRKSVIDKEVENTKRDSYIEQISTLETKFGISTLKKFDNWPKYVEITQRRNIMMHCNGIVSEQYIDNCKKHGYHDDKIKIGDKLQLDYNYIIEAIFVMEEVCVKLTQVLWRKLFKENVEEYDQALNTYIFNILKQEEWVLAAELGKFAINLNVVSSDSYKMLFKINYCIALKKMKKNDELQHIFRTTDISALSDEFKLAFSVLKDNFDGAYEFMKKIGNSGYFFDEKSYISFPLFENISKENKFVETFKEVFGKDYPSSVVSLKVNKAKKQSNTDSSKDTEELLEETPIDKV